MRLAALAVVLGLAQPGAAGSRCGKAKLGEICEEAEVELAAGANPLDAPVIDSSVTYLVAGPAAGKHGYLVVEPTVTGDYSVYLGGPAVAMQIRDEHPVCSGPAGGCMRVVTTYALTAGKRYEIEL